MTLRWDHLKNKCQKSASGNKVTLAIVALIDTKIVAVSPYYFHHKHSYTHLFIYKRLDNRERR